MSDAPKKAEIGFVPSRWDVGPLVTFLDKITYGFTNPMPDALSGPWKLTAKDVVDGRINFETARHTTQEAFEKDLTEKSKPRIDDVLLTKDGSIGRVAVVDRDGVCINQSVALLRPNGKILPHFLKYLLLTPHYQEVMERDSDGSTIKHIYITRVDKMEVAVPPIDEQGDILDILKSIDDKIELNRRMNETLDAMARAIFKSWFVDFDPVRAKASGESSESICRQFGLTPELLALFPDSLENCELGAIPEGWAQQRIDDLMELAYGKALKATDRLEGPVPVYGSGGITGLHTEHLVNGPGVIVGRKGTVGSLYWEDRPFYPIDTVFYVVPKVEITFCFYLLQTLGLERMNTDAAVPGLNRNNVYRLPVTLPPIGLREGFGKVVTSLRNHMFENDQESQTLADVRDNLLPKLISGELPVPVHGAA